jgi:DNA-binding beta-propeller fold protein YncE
VASVLDQLVSRQFLLIAGIFVLNTLLYGQIDRAMIFKSTCSRCHGTDGTGDTDVGAAMSVPDLHATTIQKASDAELTEVIKSGKGAQMPPFNGKLTDDQIKQLVSYIREFSNVPNEPASHSKYNLIKKIPIPGKGSWDYLTVDDAARRLYVSHGSQVEVLDVDSGEIVGKIENTPGVHGIATAAELNRGFVSNGQSSTVTIFDLRTLKAIGEVATGKKPDAIIYDAATSRVFAFNGGSDSSTVIEAADGKVAGTISLGGGPEFAAADGNGYIYDNLEDQSRVLKINSRTLKVEQRWPTAPCSSPSSMAMDLSNRRLFVGCRNKLMAVMSADTGQVITTLPIGDHVDATAFDRDSGLIFNSNGEGTVTLIHEDTPDKYSVVETVNTLPGARTMALDPKTHRLFLSAEEGEQFEVLVVGKHSNR